jgi:hypothetical protein
MRRLFCRLVLDRIACDLGRGCRKLYLYNIYHFIDLERGGFGEIFHHWSIITQGNISPNPPSGWSINYIQYYIPIIRPSNSEYKTCHTLCDRRAWSMRIATPRWYDQITRAIWLKSWSLAVRQIRWRDSMINFMLKLHKLSSLIGHLALNLRYDITTGLITFPCSWPHALITTTFQTL